ncbi:MAG: OadG family protein [Mariprofundus sp.]|nr:OadG family protein [Mariprofundus sp.]
MDELMQAGLQLMALGMGVVFLFLGLLIGVINLTSLLIQKFETAPVDTSNTSTTVGNTDLIEVVTNAVKLYRSEHPHRKG